MHDRTHLLQAFWNRLGGLRAEAPRAVAQMKAELPLRCEADSVSSVVVAAKMLSQDLVTDALLTWRASGADPWPAIAESLALLYWMNEIDIHDFVATAAPYDAADSQIHARCVFHSLMLQAGADDKADWIAPFLLQLFRQGAWFDADLAFGRFYERLLTAQVDQRWLTGAECEDGLAPEAAALLAALPDANAWPGALSNYCDMRLARAHRYPSLAASKKARSAFVFERIWWGVLPFELFALQAIYRRVTGTSVGLLIDHPLLAPALMRPPALVPLVATPQTQAMQGFIARVFGPAWQPLRAVPLAPAPGR